jgi:hypothetical protein
LRRAVFCVEFRIFAGLRLVRQLRIHFHVFIPSQLFLQ